TNQLHFSDLKAGRLDDRVVTSLLRFWEARNVKKSGELMSVDFMLLNEKCRRHSKITGKKVTVGLISATPLNATLLFPTAALKPSSSMGGGIVKCIDLVMFRAVYMPYLHGQLQPHTWCEAGSSQGVKREKTLESSFVGSKRKHGNGGETHFNELGNGDTGKTAMVSRGELTFQNIYGAEALLNAEDEDGYSGWEPLQQKMPVEFVKWCCFNCTMANPASAITWLRHGYFASLLFKRHWSLTEVEEKCGGNSSAASSTAVGFEEIMLLHSEVYTLEHVNFTSQLLYRFEFTCNVPGLLHRRHILISIEHLLLI
ncbi:hypothetical protein IGI04_026786, partial [Brassica rapa subsp. trilocularis]